ncbi:hypothetical protein EVAR_46046_1 [Eumeta japonica]|uniref:Uncharacterized protein n=1 Tax=Eumeta variegata TaxID=151549 RepID=A0A4C1XIE9_EUMVA|nr:hypothetical protein EVAR_46046_1 [Eumeta japonica]
MPQTDTYNSCTNCYPGVSIQVPSDNNSSTTEMFRQLRSQMSETATYDTSIAQLLPWKSTLPKPTPSKPVCYPGSPDPVAHHLTDHSCSTCLSATTTIGLNVTCSTDSGCPETCNNFFTKLFPSTTQGVPRLRRSLLNVSWI